MQPHCALILALKSFRGVLPLLVIVNCSDDKWGPCLLKTTDLDSVYRSPCVPWPPSSAHAGGRDICCLDPGATIPGQSLGSAGDCGFLGSNYRLHCTVSPECSALSLLPRAPSFQPPNLPVRRYVQIKRTWAWVSESHLGLGSAIHSLANCLALGELPNLSEPLFPLL